MKRKVKWKLAVGLMAVMTLSAPAAFAEEGTVKMFNSSKGYGFIKTASGGDLFVHKSDVGDAELRAGDCVEFSTKPAIKGGLQAAHVMIFECPAPAAPAVDPQLSTGPIPNPSASQPAGSN